MYYTPENHLNYIKYLEKSYFKYKINIIYQNYANLWFVTSTDLSVIFSEFLSLPQAISLPNKMELRETCHFKQFFLLFLRDHTMPSQKGLTISGEV